MVKHNQSIVRAFPIKMMEVFRPTMCLSVFKENFGFIPRNPTLSLTESRLMNLQSKGVFVCFRILFAFNSHVSLSGTTNLIQINYLFVRSVSHLLAAHRFIFSENSRSFSIRVKLNSA